MSILTLSSFYKYTNNPCKWTLHKTFFPHASWRFHCTKNCVVRYMFFITVRLTRIDWLINGFVTRLTRRMPLVEQELLTLPEHTSSHPVFSAVRVTVLCVCFVDRCLFFFLLAIVLSVLRFTDSDYPFSIFKLFFKRSKQKP
jgi:hypothetical protein